MSVEEVKELISQMNTRQRREIQQYLAQLRNQTPDCKRETARLRREVVAVNEEFSPPPKRRLRF